MVMDKDAHLEETQGTLRHSRLTVMSISIFPGLLDERTADCDAMKGTPKNMASQIKASSFQV